MANKRFLIEGCEIGTKEIVSDSIDAVMIHLKMLWKRLNYRWFVSINHRVDDIPAGKWDGGILAKRGYQRFYTNSSKLNKNVEFGPHCKEQSFNIAHRLPNSYYEKRSLCSLNELGEEESS